MTDDLRAENERLRIGVGNLQWRIRDLEAQLRDAESLNRALKTAHEELRQLFTASSATGLAPGRDRPPHGYDERTAS